MIMQKNGVGAYLPQGYLTPQVLIDPYRRAAIRWPGALPGAARGVGDYDQVGNWSWEFYPPPYAFTNPDGIAPPRRFYAPAATMGLSGCGCGGKCGGAGHSHDCGGGLGLFDSTDISQWGIGEWAAIAAGGYLAISLFGDFGSAAKKVKKVRSRSRIKKSRDAEARKQLGGSLF